jgi:hypothetical protein
MWAQLDARLIEQKGIPSRQDEKLDGQPDSPAFQELPNLAARRRRRLLMMMRRCNVPANNSAGIRKAAPGSRS